MEIEVEEFETSILYWVSMLEGMVNQRFVEEYGGGKSAVPRWRTLSILAGVKVATINDLSRQTQIERTALSHLLNQMEAEELLMRRTNENDRRVIEVHLLPKGHALFRDMLPVRRAVFRNATRDVPWESIEQMMATTKQLVANLSRGPNV